MLVQTGPCGCTWSKCDIIASLKVCGNLWLLCHWFVSSMLSGWCIVVMHYFLSQASWLMQIHSFTLFTLVFIEQCGWSFMEILGNWAFNAEKEMHICNLSALIVIQAYVEVKMSVLSGQRVDLFLVYMAEKLGKWKCNEWKVYLVHELKTAFPFLLHVFPVFPGFSLSNRVRWGFSTARFTLKSWTPRSPGVFVF